jgi:dienelactone hydrolase
MKLRKVLLTCWAFQFFLGSCVPLFLLRLMGSFRRVLYLVQMTCFDWLVRLLRARTAEIARALALLAFVSFAATPAWAQQNVRLKPDLPAQVYKPAHGKPAPAVAIFHGCSGPGVNNARMAQLIQGWGYVALVVDSFSARGMTDVCGRNWPTQAQAETRTQDLAAAAEWLNAQAYVKRGELAAMGYSYGGGVVALKAFAPSTVTAPSDYRAYVLVYPDCNLADALGQKLKVQAPTLFTMGALDDWTPPSQCQAVIGRVASGRELIETKMYEGAHHSFDALGVAVRYSPNAPNRSKPGGCCGAHYGAHEPAWRQFQTDVKAFLEKRLPLWAR